MGLAKKTETQAESGTEAALARLQSNGTSASKATEYVNEKPTYRQRDFDREARGKSLCLLYGHAIGSCLVAGLQFEKREEAFAHMKFFVDAAMTEIFKDHA